MWLCGVVSSCRVCFFLAHALEGAHSLIRMFSIGIIEISLFFLNFNLLVFFVSYSSGASFKSSHMEKFDAIELNSILNSNLLLAVYTFHFSVSVGCSFCRCIVSAPMFRMWREQMKKKAHPSFQIQNPEIPMRSTAVMGEKHQ